MNVRESTGPSDRIEQIGTTPADRYRRALKLTDLWGIKDEEAFKIASDLIVTPSEKYIAHK